MVERESCFGTWRGGRNSRWERSFEEDNTYSIVTRAGNNASVRLEGQYSVDGDEKRWNS